MTSTIYQLPLTFEQILTLVKQLPPDEKQQLSQELAKDLIDSKLSDFLTTFHTDDLSLNTITAEVETVRSEFHAVRSEHHVQPPSY